MEEEVWQYLFSLEREGSAMDCRLSILHSTFKQTLYQEPAFYLISKAFPKVEALLAGRNN